MVGGFLLVSAGAGLIAIGGVTAGYYGVKYYNDREFRKRFRAKVHNK